MQHAFRSWILNLLAVVGALLVATLLRWALDEWLVAGWRPIVTMYGAVAFVAWFSGWRWATITAIAGYVVIDSIFRGPHAVTAIGTLGGLAGYTFSCGVIIAVGQAARRAHARALLAAKIAQEQATARYEGQERLAAIVESSEDAIVSRTPEGIITSFNRGAQRIFGHDAADVIGQHIAVLCSSQRTDEFDSIMERLQNGERIDAYETVRRRSDGLLVDLSVTVSAIRDAEGRLIGASETARDISEHKRLDQEREQADRRLAIQYAVTRILAEVDSPDEAVTGVLGAAGEALGWSLGALWSVDWSRTMLRCTALWCDPMKSAPHFIAATRDATFARGVGLPGRVWASGQPAWIEDVVKDPNFPRAPQAQADGLHGALAFPVIVGEEVVAILEFFNDAILMPDEDLLQQFTSISRQLGQFIRRKSAEQTLRESEQRFRHVVNSVPAAVWTADASGAMTWASERWFASAGPTEDDIAAEWTRVLHPDDHQRYLDRWAAAVRDGREFQIEVRNRRQDGEYRWWLTQAIPVKNFPGRVVSWFGSSTDIHDLRLAQDALRESEERFTAFMRHLPGAAWMKDLDGRYIYANREAERNFNTTHDALIGHRDHEIFPRDIAEQFLENDRKAIDEGSAQVIETLRRDDGEYQSIVSKFVVRGASGRPEAIAGVAFDVTERLRAESARRESDERLRLALQAGKAGVWEWDIRDNRVTWSDYLYELHGVSRESFAGTLDAFAKLVHPEDLPMVRQRLDATFEGNEPYDLEYRIVWPDGQVRWNATSAAVLRENEAPVRMYGVCTDITERKLIEAELDRHRDHLRQLVIERTAALEQSHQRLRQSERMAAVGTLAAGIGHDLGNLLLPMRGHLDRLRRLSLAPEAREHITPIASCVEYLQNLYRGLRQFALDPDEGAAETSDLDAWRTQVESFFRSAVPRHVAFEWSMPMSLPRLAMAPHALTQAVYNLVLNAGDVLRERADARVGLTAEADVQHGRVRITVSDNGPGMSEEVRRHCLEPFFTTKPRGHSTGLGLSLVHRIVQQAGGSIEIESQPGAGTRFVLTMPVCAQDAEHALQPAAARLGAVLTVADKRLAALIESFLPASGVKAVRQAGTDHAAAMIWMTDDATDIESRTREFIERGPRHHCVLLEHERGSMQGLASDRIIVLPARSGLSSYQAAIRQCVAGIRDLQVTTRESMAEAPSATAATAR